MENSVQINGVTYVRADSVPTGNRAVLAQPEPEEPTDEELLALMPESMRDEFSYAAKVSSDATGGQVKPGIFRVCLNHSALEYARAVLARWGRPAVELVPVNDLVDLAYELRKTAEYLQGGCGWAKALDAIERAATLIESNALRLITPIPVSERPILKASDFNDADGRCWCGSGGFIDETGDMPVEMPASWELREPCSQDDWVLPHYALPVPTQQ